MKSCFLYGITELIIIHQVYELSFFVWSIRVRQTQISRPSRHSITKSSTCPPKVRKPHLVTSTTLSRWGRPLPLLLTIMDIHPLSQMFLWTTVSSASQHINKRGVKPTRSSSSVSAFPVKCLLSLLMLSCSLSHIPVTMMTRTWMFPLLTWSSPPAKRLCPKQTRVMHYLPRPSRHSCRQSSPAWSWPRNPRRMCGPWMVRTRWSASHLSWSLHRSHMYRYLS